MYTRVLIFMHTLFVLNQDVILKYLRWMNRAAILHSLCTVYKRIFFFWHFIFLWLNFLIYSFFRLHNLWILFFTWFIRTKAPIAMFPHYEKYIWFNNIFELSYLRYCLVLHWYINVRVDCISFCRLYFGKWNLIRFLLISGQTYFIINVDLITCPASSTCTF